MGYGAEFFEPYKDKCPTTKKDMVWLPETSPVSLEWIFVLLGGFTGSKMFYRCSVSGKKKCADCGTYRP